MSSGFEPAPESNAVIEQWRCHDNDVRPNSSLGYLTPKEFRTKSGLRGKNTSTLGAVLQ